MRRIRRGDLSAPVLAIIVTVGVIAAGLVLMAWFWWFAPQAGKVGALQIIGQPAVICRTADSTVVLSVKNVGREPIEITAIYVGELTYTPSPSVTVDPGEHEDISITGDTCPANWEYAVDGAILTTAGTYVTSFTVIRG